MKYISLILLIGFVACKFPKYDVYKERTDTVIFRMGDTLIIEDTIYYFTKGSSKEARFNIKKLSVNQK